ncbi:MAG: hypothetical protein R2749_16525 [Acidimicrobiales bacterium]
MAALRLHVHRTLTIAALDLRRRLRNRSAIITAVVGPLAMAIVFGLLVSGTSTVSFRIGVVDLDGSPSPRSSWWPPSPHRLVRRTDPVAATMRWQIFEARTATDIDAVADAVQADGIDAALVIPPVPRDRRHLGGHTALTVVRDPEQLLAGEVAASVASSKPPATGRSAWPSPPPPPSPPLPL